MRDYDGGKNDRPLQFAAQVGQQRCLDLTLIK